MKRKIYKVGLGNIKVFCAIALMTICISVKSQVPQYSVVSEEDDWVNCWQFSDGISYLAQGNPQGMKYFNDTLEFIAQPNALNPTFYSRSTPGLSYEDNIWYDASPVNNTDIFIQKHNSSGDSIWSTIVPFEEYANTVFTPWSAFNLRLNEENNIVILAWRPFYNSTTNEFDSTLCKWKFVDSNTGLIVQEGQHTWIDSPGQRDVYDVKFLDGEMILYGIKAESLGNVSDGESFYFVDRFDYNGNLLSEININSVLNKEINYSNYMSLGNLQTDVITLTSTQEASGDVSDDFIFRLDLSGTIIDSMSVGLTADVEFYQVVNNQQLVYLRRDNNVYFVGKKDFVSSTLLWEQAVYSSTDIFYNGVLNYVDDQHVLLALETSVNDILIKVVQETDSEEVWPGDANSDGVADLYDVFPIGLANGTTGSLRAGASLLWEAQPTEEWASDFSNGTNYAHADCNGDGIIDTNDIEAVSVNYGLIHAKDEGLNEATAVDPDLYFDVNIDTVLAGSTISVPVMLGTSSLPMNDIYGIAFSLNFDADLVEEISISFADSWIGDEGYDLAHLHKAFIEEGQLDVGMVRTNQMNTSGYGQIAQVEIVTSDDLTGKQSDILETLILSFSNVKAINLNEEDLIVDASSTTEVTLEDVSTSIKPIVADDLFHIFPNPVKENMVVEFSNSGFHTIQVMNVVGDVVLNQSTTNTQLTINVNDLAKGMYTVRIQEGTKIFSKKILVF